MIPWQELIHSSFSDLTDWVAFGYIWEEPDSVFSRACLRPPYLPEGPERWSSAQQTQPCPPTPACAGTAAQRAPPQRAGGRSGRKKRIEWRNEKKKKKSQKG